MKRFSSLSGIREMQIHKKDGQSQALVRTWSINRRNFGNYLASFLELEISIRYDKGDPILEKKMEASNKQDNRTTSTSQGCSRLTRMYKPVCHREMAPPGHEDAGSGRPT